VSCLRQVTTVMAFAILVILATNDLQAQQTLGGITGTVVDPSGSAVPGVEVKAVSDDTKLVRTAKSNAEGTYSLVDLPIGAYTITFTREGFSVEKVPGILVQANRTVTLPGHLALGAVADSVTVDVNPLLNAVDPTNGDLKKDAHTSRRKIADPAQFAVIPPALYPTTNSARRFFERRVSRITKAWGSPNTPVTVSAGWNPGKR